MLRRVVGLAVMAVAIALILSPQSAWAQKGKKTPKTVQGKLAQMVPGQGIILADDMNNPVAVGINQATKVVVSGTTLPAALTRGMFIQFTAKVDSAGEVQGPLKDPMIMQPYDEYTQPIFQSMSGPEVQLAPGEPDTYMVRGQIQTNKNGELVVQAPGKVVRVTIPEKTKIQVQLPNLGLASPGDAVKATGSELGANPVRIMADSVEVTLSATLGEQASN